MGRYKTKIVPIYGGKMTSNRAFVILLIILSLVLKYTHVHAAVIDVPADQPTIQAGINAAKNGDTVSVADGIYRGEGNVNIDFKGKQITVKSLNGAKTTIIDCEKETETRGFTFHNEETNDSVLDGFTIRNGVHELGGGIYCNDASPTIKNCVIAWNRAAENDRDAGRGGGIYCFNSDTKIIDSTISNNRAESAYGGGVYFDGDMIIDGVFVRETVNQPSLLSCTISDNTGSGVHIQHFINPELRDSKILHNSWCGIVCTSFHTSGTYITHCEIAQNTGGGVAVFQYSSLEITNSIIKQNTAREGGGISCGPTAIVYISYCIIAENVATESGGGIAANGDTTVEFCTITQNRAHEEGGGIYVFTDAHFLLSNSIIWGNEADISHSEASITQYLFGRITIMANDINGKIEGIVRIFEWDRSQSLIEGNIHEDPLFVDAAGGNYRVKPNSPAYAIGAHSILDGLVSVTPVGNKVVMWADLKRKR